MSNIFIQLNANLVFKREVLEQIIQKEANEQIPNQIQTFFQNEGQQILQYANFIFNLLTKVVIRQVKEKLMITLIYLCANLKGNECLQIIKKVYNMNESIVFKVRFFSLVYKNANQQQLKKWILFSSIDLIVQQEKISYFSSFVQNFQQILSLVSIKSEEIIKIYSKLIQYLEKHPIYKKLLQTYIINSLLHVANENCNSQDVNLLIIKVIKFSNTTQHSFKLLLHQPLKQNLFYQYLQTYLVADFVKFQTLKKDKLEKYQVNISQLIRKMKVQSIPMLFSMISVASYSQVSQLLQIKKQEVQSYIIEGIKDGLLKAKLDQYQQTVLIKRVNFKHLRQQEKVKLQLDLSALINKLDKI